MSEKQLMDHDAVERALKRMTHQIIEQNKGVDNLVIIGIQRRGVCLGRRIVEYIHEFEKRDVEFGILDITLYRDDLSLLSEHPIINDTDMSFIIDNKTIVLVDDVLFTGRTLHAAINALFDMGRAKKIEPAILIDRGHREIPLKATYIGKNVPTSIHERIEVGVPEYEGDLYVKVVSPDCPE